MGGEAVSAVRPSVKTQSSGIVCPDLESTHWTESGREASSMSPANQLPAVGQH